MNHHFEANSLTDFMGLVRRHYQLHSAEYFLPPNRPQQTHFRMDLIRAGSLAVGRYAGSDFTARREWRHIRDSQSASTSYFVRFPIQGAVRCSQGRNRSSIEVGQGVITSNIRPVLLEFASADGAECVTINVRVPSHMIRIYIPFVDNLCGIPFCAESSSGHIAREIFSHLLWMDDDISSVVVEELAQVGMRATADAVSACGDIRKKRVGRELEIILSFIKDNMTVPGITVKMVADNLNISPRLIHYRMKESGMSFNDYLWGLRLTQAANWISNPEFRHLNVSDIAYLVGFKSVTHFTAAYRKRFGCTPGYSRK